MIAYLYLCFYKLEMLSSFTCIFKAMKVFINLLLFWKHLFAQFFTNNYEYVTAICID